MKADATARKHLAGRCLCSALQLAVSILNSLKKLKLLRSKGDGEAKKGGVNKRKKRKAIKGKNKKKKVEEE
jgi:hypothetical protein